MAALVIPLNLFMINFVEGALRLAGHKPPEVGDSTGARYTRYFRSFLLPFVFANKPRTIPNIQSIYVKLNIRLVKSDASLNLWQEAKSTTTHYRRRRKLKNNGACQKCSTVRPPPPNNLRSRDSFRIHNTHFTIENRRLNRGLFREKFESMAVEIRKHDFKTIFLR